MIRKVKWQGMEVTNELIDALLDIDLTDEQQEKLAIGIRSMSDDHYLLPVRLDNELDSLVGDILGPDDKGDLIAGFKSIIHKVKREERKTKNKIYRERNSLVAVLAKLYPSYRAVHEESDTSWEKDWRNIIVIKIPVNNGLEREWKQCSWHIHDSELPDFAHLRLETNHVWDGHTMEVKYERLRNIDI